MPRDAWRQRVGGDYHASPIRVGNRIFGVSLDGEVSVLAAEQQFKLLAQNQLGDEAFASPAICGSRIYLRSAKKGTSRQEYLWCIGE